MISDSATQVATIAANQANPHTTIVQAVDVLIRHRQDDVKQTQEAVQDAVDIIQHFAKKGDKVAMYNEAMILMYGIGVSKDFTRALRILGDVKLAQYPPAMYKRARLFRDQGEFKEANKLFEAAARQGHVPSLRFMGLSFFYATGVAQDKERSKRILTTCAMELDYDKAALDLKTLFPTPVSESKPKRVREESKRDLTRSPVKLAKYDVLLSLIWKSILNTSGFVSWSGKFNRCDSVCTPGMFTYTFDEDAGVSYLLTVRKQLGEFLKYAAPGTTSTVIDLLSVLSCEVEEILPTKAILGGLGFKSHKIAQRAIGPVLRIPLSAIIEAAKRFSGNGPVFEFYPPCEGGDCQTKARLRKKGVNAPYLCYAAPEDVNSLSKYRLVSKPPRVVLYPKNKETPSDLAKLTNNPTLGPALKQMSKCTHRLL
jgi:hypothetical protein